MYKNKLLYTLLFLLCIPFIVNAQSIEMTGTEVNVRSGPGTKYGAIGQTDAIIKVLYDCITEKESTNISEVLELSEEETRTLESNLDAKEYNIFCTFPEVVKANYDTIRNLHVAEPAKCITEHPKRFMNNPDVFDDILDKYDTPDLVRCINKNPAVIDKL